MSLTVLLDLDDTLLSAHMDRFLPLYFDLLSQALSHLGPKEKITSQVDTAVGMMLTNQNPTRTLREVFNENFYPQLGTTEDVCQPILATFYQQEYPHVQSVTQVRPEASNLVKWCQSQGLQIAIATNPLFPHSATFQRIQWAGLEPNDFALFTVYDDFHFTKPHLAYYAEILGRMGWPEKPAVMIGDNLSDDLFPTDTFGFATFWIKNGNQENLWTGGNLGDVKAWLQQELGTNGQPLAVNPLVDIATLRATPAVIDTWLRAEPNWGPNVRKNPPAANVVETLHRLMHFEEQVYPHLWQKAQLGKFADVSLTHPSALEKIPIEDNQSIEQAFARFFKKRESALSKLDNFHKEASQHRDENITRSVNEFASWAADNDRELLRRAINL
ncbi:MAG: HAD family hydrolase [Chloroflexi bacterium]|nr:HAD family hydrolase [Chloroflexota bacterium]